MKKYHEIKNVAISKDKLKLLIDKREYEFLLASISQKLTSTDGYQKIILRCHLPAMEFIGH